VRERVKREKEREREHEAMPFVAIHHDLHGSSFCFAVFCDLLFSFFCCCRSGIGTLSAMVCHEPERVAVLWAAAALSVGQCTFC